MTDGMAEKPPEQVRGWPFVKGRSGNPAGRRFGSRNQATMAAQALLADEAEALTRQQDRSDIWPALPDAELAGLQPAEILACQGDRQRGDRAEQDKRDQGLA